MQIFQQIPGLCTMNTKNSEAILKLPGVFIPEIDPSTFTQSAFHSYVQNNQKKLNMKGYDSIRTLVYTDVHGGTGSASMLIPPGFMVLDAHGNNELGLEADCMVPSEYAKLHLQRADWQGLKIDNLPPHTVLIRAEVLWRNGSSFGQVPVRGKTFSLVLLVCIIGKVG
ncbi:hypothetical protein BT96DRAFT_71445 [Gymnopus androsaceus JB14]|uniref:Uncharacterized protein n=1 Tax=Gymnopus androsaceus JB14 TaxID=1447944 RepID=A0A6A4HKE3_9AGAR|nr:hypothetical protein BT96DRAFT_71445 [Gymnopus androsaceus JB14]